MAEKLIIGGQLYDDIDYITIRNKNKENIKYYKGGQGGGGGGSGINFRTATVNEIDAILSGEADFQQSTLNTSQYRAATIDEINNILRGGEVYG